MSQKLKAIIITTAGVLLIAAIYLLLVNREYTFNGVLYQNPEPAPDFSLKSENGEFVLSDQEGKVVLLFFGYTSCPDVCPSSLSDMKRVFEGLKTGQDLVEVVFITVDPERDTAKKLDEYVKLFNSSFIGLTGDLEQLEPVWDSYGVIREVDQETESMAGYLINHTARIYLVDQNGNLLLTYGFGTPSDEILEDVEYLVGEK
jgi:protein SCO1/2